MTLMWRLQKEGIRKKAVHEYEEGKKTVLRNNGALLFYSLSPLNVIVATEP